jgi:hypothetical protein
MDEPTPVCQYMSENARLKIQNTTLQREKEELVRQVEELKGQLVPPSIILKDEIVRREILHLEGLELLSPIEAEKLFQTLGIARTPLPPPAAKAGEVFAILCYNQHGAWFEVNGQKVANVEIDPSTMNYGRPVPCNDRLESLERSSGRFVCHLPQKLNCSLHFRSFV